jgi:hypothetical protein
MVDFVCLVACFLNLLAGKIILDDVNARAASLIVSSSRFSSILLFSAAVCSLFRCILMILFNFLNLLDSTTPDRLFFDAEYINI